MPDDYKGVDNPVVELHPSKATKKKSLVAFTRSGDTLDIPADQHTVVSHSGLDYMVALLPTVIRVVIGRADYRVLCFYGYHEPLKRVVLFTVNGNCAGYGASTINGQVIFDQTQKMPASSSPAWAHSPTEPAIAQGHDVRRLSEALVDFKSSKLEKKLSMGRENPDEDSEVIDAAVEAQEYSIKKKLAELVSPTNQNLVINVEISDDQLTRVLRKKSDVAKQRGEITQQPKLSFDPIENARKMLKLEPGGAFPMPIATVMVEKPASPLLKMPTSVSERVDGQELL